MSAKEIYTQYAQDHGMRYDEDTGVLYGVVNGHTFCITKTESSSTNHFIAVVSVKPQEENSSDTGFNDGLNNLRKASKRISGYSVAGRKVIFDIIGGNTLGKSMEYVAASVDDISNFLNTTGYIDCCEGCGEERGVEACAINGVGSLFCSNCYEQNVAAFEQKKQSVKIKKGNMGTGIVGALLGSIIGVVVFVVLGQFGFIAVISGIIMAICTLKGYELFGGKISKAGIAVSCAIMAVMIFLAQNIDLAMSFSTQMAAEGYELSFFESLRLVPDLFVEGMVELGVYFTNLGIAYLLAIVGAVPVIRNMYRQKSGRYSAKRLGEQAAPEEAAEAASPSEI